MSILRGKKDWFLLTWLSCCWVSVSTAQFTQEDVAFFDSTKSDYQTWLDLVGLSPVLKVEKITTQPHCVTLELVASDRHSWAYLRATYSDSFQTRLAEALFEKMCFQMEVPPDSAALLVHTPNQDYKVVVFYENKTLVIRDPLPEDVRLKGNGDPIALKTAFGLPKRTFLKTDNFHQNDQKKTRKRIINYLRAYYETKPQFWGRQAQVEFIENENEIAIEVTNISKEILNDFVIGYFELIIINIFIEPNGDVLEISYDFKGKYGSGIFIAPRRSGYKDMETKFPDYLERYDKRLRSMLTDVLQASEIKN